jgi:hypothetical protein
MLLKSIQNQLPIGWNSANPNINKLTNWTPPVFTYHKQIKFNKILLNAIEAKFQVMSFVSYL